MHHDEMKGKPEHALLWLACWLAAEWSVPTTTTTTSSPVASYGMYAPYMTHVVGYAYLAEVRLPCDSLVDYRGVRTGMHAPSNKYARV